MLKRIAFVVALFALPALAQDTSPQQAAPQQATPMSHGPATPEIRAAFQAMRQACAGDITTFCKDVEPGGGKIAKCLRDHRADLSGGCKIAWQNLRAARQSAPH